MKALGFPELERRPDTHPKTTDASAASVPTKVRRTIVSEFRQLKVTARERSGKGVARKLRAQGLAPAVVYGQKKPHRSITVSPQELRKAMDPELKRNTLFSLEIEGKDPESVLCMLSDVQFNSVRDDILHVDFLRVSADEEVQVQVPVAYHGRPVGVAMGGKLRTFRRVVKVAAKPADIPKVVNIDISGLEGGASLRFGDLTIENARILEAPQTVAAQVEMPRQNRQAKGDEEKGK